MYKLIFILLTSATLSTAADVTGTWQLTVETSAGSGTPTLDLKQNGEQLTGTLHSVIFGDVSVTGTVKGDQIQFEGTGEAAGVTMKVTYKGTVLNAAEMKGTAVYPGLDDNATWSATKK